MLVGGYGGCRGERDQELDSSCANPANVVFFVKSKGDDFRIADSISLGLDDPMKMTSVGGLYDSVWGKGLRCFEYNLDRSSIAAARGKDDVVRRSGASPCAIDAAVSSVN